jgi:hypothetical protein
MWRAPVQTTEEIILGLGYAWDTIAALKERGVVPSRA